MAKLSRIWSDRRPVGLLCLSMAKTSFWNWSNLLTWVYVFVLEAEHSSGSKASCLAFGCECLFWWNKIPQDLKWIGFLLLGASVGLGGTRFIRIWSKLPCFWVHVFVLETWNSLGFKANWWLTFGCECLFWWNKIPQALKQAALILGASVCFGGIKFLRIWSELITYFWVRVSVLAA